LLTVSTPPQLAFIQRSRYSDLTPVPVTVTGPPGTVIDMSWRTADGGPAPLSDWQAAPGLAGAQIPQSGTAVVTLPIPTGGPYVAAVRDRNAPADQATSVAPVIAGDIHLWAGQSLGEHMHASADRHTPLPPPSSRIWTPGAKSWALPTGSGANTFLQVLSLMTPGLPHAIQFATFGGTALTPEAHKAWSGQGPQPGFFLDAGGPLWGQIVADLHASQNPAVGIDVCDIIWDQGQHDTVSYLTPTMGVRADTYARAVAEVVGRLTSLIVRPNPFVFIAPLGVTLYNVQGQVPNVVEIRHGQDKAAAVIPNARLLPRSSDLDVPDLVHHSAAANAIRGARFAAAVYVAEY
jgi:hypothetical protein